MCGIPRHKPSKTLCGPISSSTRGNNMKQSTIKNPNKKDVDERIGLGDINSGDDIPSEVENELK